MQAIDILMSEHRVIENVLETLDEAVRRLESGQQVRPGLFLEVADFIQGFADGCHHQKEEGVLFRKMAENGVPVEGGPIGVMLVEHEHGRRYTQGMRQAAQAFEAGDIRAKEEIVRNAKGYVSLLHQHIYKEDHILFPMADRAIPETAHVSVLEGFEYVEHEETGQGVHEKYLALAKSLHNEVFGE